MFYQDFSVSFINLFVLDNGPIYRICCKTKSILFTMSVSLHVRLTLNFVALLKKRTICMVSNWISFTSSWRSLSLSLSLSLSFSPSLPLFHTHFFLSSKLSLRYLSTKFYSCCNLRSAFFQPVLDGRRIVGLPHLFRQLEAGCFFCGKKPLLRTKCQKEVRSGL